MTGFKFSYEPYDGTRSIREWLDDFGDRWVYDPEGTMLPISDELLERMAEASWDSHGTVKWADFFTGGNAHKKQFYLDSMRAAVSVLLKAEGKP